MIPEALVVTPPAIPWLGAGRPPIAPPVIPWLERGTPIARPCPAGWSSVDDRCEPWPDGAPPCTGAMIRAPGEPACRPLTPSCPAGDFASGLAADAVYVLAGAPAGGDGTIGLPFATLDDALRSVGPGRTIALSRGTHAISGTVDLDVSLRGACAAETILTSASARFAVARALSIEDLTIHPGEANDPIFVDGDHDVAIRRVLLDGGRGYGVTGSGGARLELTDVRIQGVRVRLVASGAQPVSAALRAQLGSAVTGTRVVVDDATWVGASASAAQISLTDSILRGAHEATDLTDSAGATCWRDGNLSFTRTLLESNVSRGVEVLAGCSATTLDDVVIRRTIAGTSGLAFGIVTGGPVVASGLGAFDNAESAVVAIGAGRAELSDVVVDGVSGEGTALAAAQGGMLVVRRAIVLGGTAGFYAADAGVIDAEDLLFERIAGAGVWSQTGSTVTVRRLHASDVQTGLISIGTGSAITASDVIVERVGAVSQPDSDALTARAAGRIDVQRAIVRDAMGTAVAAIQPDAVAIVQDITCTGGSQGFVARDGRVEITNAEVSGAAESGGVVLASTSSTALLTLTNVWLHDLPVVAPGGIAVIASDGSVLELHAVVVESAGVGVYAAAAGDGPTPTVRIEDAIFRSLSAPGVWLDVGTATLTRVEIERPQLVGLVARGARVDVTLADVAIDHPMANAEARFGHGIHVTEGAQLRGTRVTVASALGVGLLASDPRTQVTLDSFWVRDTREESCAGACAGHGVVSLFEAAMSLTHFRTSGSAWAGVVLSDGGTIALTEGSVDGNRVGRALLDVARTGLVEIGVTYSTNEAFEARAGVTVPNSSLL